MPLNMMMMKPKSQTEQKVASQVKLGCGKEAKRLTIGGGRVTK